MKKCLLSAIVALSVFLFFGDIIKAGDHIPKLSLETQRSIVNDLSNAYNKLARASIPIGGDTETEWAANQVDSLCTAVTTSDRPFIQQMTDIYMMNSLFAYGLNYAPSCYSIYFAMDDERFGELLKLARLGSIYGEAIVNDIKSSGYQDVISLNELSANAYVCTQFYLTMMSKLNEVEDFSDPDLCFPFTLFNQLIDIQQRGIFSERDLWVTFFVFDAINFYKVYAAYLNAYLITQEDAEYVLSISMPYAYYIDNAAGPIFTAAESTEPVSLGMSDQWFEDFMLKSTAIKVDMLNQLTKQFETLVSFQQ